MEFAMPKDPRYVQQAELLKVLAHPVRLCIVRGLSGKDRCNVTTMQECLDLPQSTVSQHVTKLRQAGIIVGERQGTEIYYHLVHEDVAALVALLFPLHWAEKTEEKEGM